MTFLSDRAGICSNDPDELKAANGPGTPVFGRRSSVAGPPNPDPDLFDDVKLDENGKAILSPEQIRALKDSGTEVIIGNGGLTGARKME